MVNNAEGVYAGWGMFMWILGAIFTAVSRNFGSLMFARIFIGFGAGLGPLQYTVSGVSTLYVPVCIIGSLTRLIDLTQQHCCVQWTNVPIGAQAEGCQAAGQLAVLPLCVQALHKGVLLDADILLSSLAMLCLWGSIACLALNG